MGYDWSFNDDETLESLFKPGVPRCYHCGTPAPEGIPDSNARCATCHFHLHTCPNCMFYNGVGCLIRSPFFWSEAGIMGQDCPSFLWRRDEDEEGGGDLLDGA